MAVEINIPKPTIDYNDLENKPALVTNHSELSLDDGTNPHGTTATDVGLGNVDNTSDLDKPISNDTQDALNLKANDSEISLVGKSNDYNDLDNKPTIPSITGLVPYTGANQDVDLGNNALNAKSIKVNGTGGAGHISMKHQSAGISASASESTLGADSSGNPIWKNDGNAQQKVMLENSAITGATKTKITYDSKGLVTSGADATTADIADSTNKRYVTDANLTKINAIDQAVSTTEKATWNGKQDALGYTAENVANKQTDLTASATKYPTVDAVNTGLATKQATLTDTNFGTFTNGLTAKTTPVDADTVNISDSADSNKAKKLSLTNLKAFLKTYFDTIYTTTSAVATQITTALASYVPNTRTVNGKSLSADISITQSDLNIFTYKSLTSSSTATGTGEVLLQSINIGSNKFSATDFLFIQSDFVRGTRTGTCQLRYYIGPNSASLVGATQIALSASANNTVGYISEFSRLFKVKGGNLDGTLASTASNVDVSTSALGSTAFDPTATLYLHITSTFSAGGDTGYLNSVLIRNF